LSSPFVFSLFSDELLGFASGIYVFVHIHALDVLENFIQSSCKHDGLGLTTERVCRGFFFTGAGGLALTVGGYVLVNHCMYNVEGGHRAVIYNRCAALPYILLYSYNRQTARMLSLSLPLSAIAEYCNQLAHLLS